MCVCWLCASPPSEVKRLSRNVELAEAASTKLRLFIEKGLDDRMKYVLVHSVGPCLVVLLPAHTSHCPAQSMRRRVS